MASTAFARERIDLDHPATWPKAVCAFLAEHHELFLRWETTQGGVSPQMFDGAVSFPDRLTPKSRLLRFKERLCGSQSSVRPRLLAS